MKELVRTELDEFIKENPYADTFDIALHFVEVSGELYKKANAEAPRYYGD